LFHVLLCDRAGRGDQAGEDGLANTTVLLGQNNYELPQGACMFSCIQSRGFFARGFVPALGGREIIKSAGKA
jgi:hypothetical protein